MSLAQILFSDGGLGHWTWAPLQKAAVMLGPVVLQILLNQLCPHYRSIPYNCTLLHCHLFSPAYSEIRMQRSRGWVFAVF